MTTVWRPVWLALIPRLALIFGSALVAGLLFGPAWGWATAAAGFLLVTFAQTRQLVILAGWLKAPDTAEFPDAGGIWGEVFLGLSRLLRADAKARKSVEIELSSFKEAIAALPDGVIFLNAENQILWANHAADLHLGIRSQRDAGAIVTHLLRTPGFAEFIRESDADATFIRQPPAARARSHALKVVPFGHRNKILVSVDVTDARRAEAIRSDFVANVSHELRTPLTVISGFLEHFIEEPGMDADERQQFVRLMSEQTRRMLSLVDDLLMLSRLEAEDAPASEENIEMTEMLAELKAEAQGLSGEHHRLTVTADNVELRGNRRELYSAFANLITNAIRYTPAGGSIDIVWRASDDGGVFAVADSGIGIAPEHLPRLTERFYRVDRGRSRDTGGTGLGLAIVKHVLLRHQAGLDIESEPGHGSTFSARFPSWRLRWRTEAVASADQSCIARQ